MIQWVLRWRMADGEVDLIDPDGSTTLTVPADLNWRKLLAHLSNGDQLSFVQT
jgi:hypothetical protein